jgi:DMSO/TMAO reductase YedYZ molybdopterin-dependent catalytic subunit
MGASRRPGNPAPGCVLAVLLLAACATPPGPSPRLGEPSRGGFSAPAAAPDWAPDAADAGSGASADAATYATPPSPELLRALEVEVLEYRGERLDSVAAFEENSIAGPQRVEIGSWRLAVDGLVERPLSLDYEALLSGPRAARVVTLHCVEGWTARVLWEGPRLAPIIAAAGPLPRANTLIFRAADGYSTSLPLAAVLGRDLILAATINGATLPPERGFPFQLVAEDRWGYKWIKWIVGIELYDDPGFLGFWEERGYNIDGSLSGPRREPGYDAGTPDEERLR